MSWRGIFRKAGIRTSGRGGRLNFTNAINISKVQSDETGLDEAAVFQHGSYTTALAYGTQTGHLIMKSMHISAAATGVYVFGDVNYITTSAISTGYIHVGYNYLSVGHNLAGGYASRARLEITASCTIGEQVACLATATVAASATLAGAGNVRAGLFELSIGAGAVIATECHCIEVRPLIAANIGGVTAGIRININCSSANYVNYGLDIRSMSANQTAAIRILMTGASAALPAGIIIEGQASSSSTITSAIKVNGAATYLFDFSSGTDGSPLTATSTPKSGTTQGYIACKDADGNACYINVFAS